MAKLTLKNISKWYGKTPVIKGVSLEVNEGEFITLLGPSGCGKTTILRLIAGFITPEEGDIFFNDTRVNDIPVNSRNTAMVFQSYALFPHMTVWQNVAFGLKMLKRQKSEIEGKVKKALELVGLADKAYRYPRQLSGGEQQRVALARALVMEPSILLFDEPLSNLDAKLRERMRIDIRELQKKLGITAIFVTHDQAEALVISDRIVVMSEGQIQQIGKPYEVYNQPNSKFAADFIGLTNFIKGSVQKYDKDEAYYIIDTEIGVLKVEERNQMLIPDDVSVTVVIRPESIEIFDNKDINSKSNIFEAKVLVKTYMGNWTDYHVEVKGQRIRVQSTGNLPYNEGDIINIYFKETECRLVEINK